MTDTPEHPMYRFADLIDVSAFARMLESFFQATGIPSGLVDADGEILAQAGWTDACTVFHRSHPETAERCRASNLAIMQDLRKGRIACETCRNGIIDYATPVVIEGRQLATLFLGQVLHAPPDLAFFRAQARQFGFDEPAYLTAIAAIPVIGKERIQSLMAVMVEMAELLAASGLARLRQASLERDLSASAERRVQLEDILDFSPVAIGWSDGAGRIEYINRQFTQLFGYTLDELPDLETWYRLAYPNEVERNGVVASWHRAVEQARELGVEPPGLDCAITCKDGSVRHVSIRASWVGRRRLLNVTDMTARWLSEQRRNAHDAMLEMVARGASLSDTLHAIAHQIEQEEESALCSILLLDEHGRLRTGAAPSLPDFYNQAIDGVEIGMGVGSCGTAAFLAQRVVVEDIQTHEYWRPYAGLAEAAGVRSCWSEPIVSSRGQVLGTFAIYHLEPRTPRAEDIERIGFAANICAIAIENRRAHEELQRRAYFDYLTGLANRRYFIERAEEELSRVLRHGGGLSILMMDIDHFKQVNDTYGHRIGDLVLQKLAEVCRGSMRTIDLAGRLGGEEFAVLLPQADGDQAAIAAERLRETLAAARIPLGNGEFLQVTASFGVVTLDSGELSIDTLLSQADQALYQAKRQGRNRVCRFRPGKPGPRGRPSNRLSS